MLFIVFRRTGLSPVFPEPNLSHDKPFCDDILYVWMGMELEWKKPVCKSCEGDSKGTHSTLKPLVSAEIRQHTENNT